MFLGNDTGCINNCIPYYYFPEIKSLCQVGTFKFQYSSLNIPIYVQGDKSLRPPSKDVDTKCEHLTFRNPYLQLGPFLLEHSNKEGNYVAMLHSLLSENEMENIKAKARGQMKATPYSIANTQHRFSYKRTSKVKYIRWIFQKN